MNARLPDISMAKTREIGVSYLRKTCGNIRHCFSVAGALALSVAAPWPSHD